MANAVISHYKTALLQAAANVSLNVNTATDGPHVVLHDGNDIAWDPALDFYDDVAAGTVGAAQFIANPTCGVVSPATFDGDNVTFPSVVGDPCEVLIIYRNNTGANGTKRLVLWLDQFVTGLPVIPNGGNITIGWNASGIFTL